MPQWQWLLREPRNERERLAKKRAYDAYKKAYALNAIPDWINIKETNEWYLECPPHLTVKHIIPITFKIDNTLVARGLHWEENLEWV